MVGRLLNTDLERVVKVNIVAPDISGDGILPRLARLLADLNGWTLNTRPDPHVDLNYSIVYCDWAQRFSDWRATPWAAYFSHYEVGTPYKVFWWDMALTGVKIKTVTADKYGRTLPGTVIKTPAPVDAQFEIIARK